jgi:hypothetical protein
LVEHFADKGKVNFKGELIEWRKYYTISDQQN